MVLMMVVFVLFREIFCNSLGFLFGWVIFLDVLDMSSDFFPTGC